MSNKSIVKKIRQKGNNLLEFPDNYVVFDLETTDFSSKFGEIIEIAGLKIFKGEIIEEFNELVKSNEPINSYTTELTGISNSMLDNEKNISVVGELFSSFVEDYIVVAHNANFDVNFLYDNFENYNIRKFNNDYIDTLRLARYLIKDTKNHKLKTLVEYFAFEDIGKHRAMVDTINTHKLLLELRKIYNNSPDLFTRKMKSYDLSLLKNEKLIEDIDENNYFYNLKVCFSGKMINFTKKECGQIIANLGGIIQNNVTLKTDILILGDTQEQLQIYGSKSSKHKKALKMQSTDHKIQIMEESDMLDLISN